MKKKIKDWINSAQKMGGLFSEGKSQSLTTSEMPISSQYPDEMLRIAIVSTPRSGNTWIKNLVAGAYQLSQLSAHRYTDVDARTFPARLAFQIHWRRDPEFQNWLPANSFRPMIISRHPLDILISILQFAVHAPETSEWLDGDEGNEATIWGAMPRSRSFIEYATSPRAAALLAVTADWWDDPNVVTVRYEDVVSHPVEWLKGLESKFGPMRMEPDSIVTQFALDQQRQYSTNSHFWQGKPGLWRTLLPEAEVKEITSYHAILFAKMGYIYDADVTLSPTQADKNWIQLAGPALQKALQRNRSTGS